MTCLLAQISDPHFGTERPPVVAALQRLVQRRQPQVAVLSGDITQRARRPQFDAAQAFMATLPVRAVLAVPGNHDVPLFDLAARAFWPYRGFERVFGSDRQPTWQSPALCVVCVDSTRRWRHKQGQVSRRQIEAVGEALASADPRALRVVALHHPMAAVAASDRINLLRGREAAARAWSAAGADVVLGGHIHLPYAVPLHERFMGLPRPLWCVQAGTAVSRRVRAGADNSVNLLGVEGPARPSCVLERCDYDERSGEFVTVSRQALTGPLAGR